MENILIKIKETEEKTAKNIELAQRNSEEKIKKARDACEKNVIDARNGFDTEQKDYATKLADTAAKAKVKGLANAKNQAKELKSKYEKNKKKAIELIVKNFEKEL